ncbi:MAG: GNAT family N-acetyltransferase [Corallococcus sp.]|nr:GNAT family N-acetyltransferase [Corallococcus sp.]
MNIRKAEKSNYKQIKALYNTAFPKEERAPFFFVKRRALQKRATMLIAENDGEFVGFAYTVPYNDIIYLFYFAVAEDKRGNGNGGAIIKLLKEYYRGKKIFLAREPLDDSADNSEQRIRRRNFYIKNGFVDLPYQIREANVIYDLMSTDGNFNPHDYNALIKNWLGGLVAHLVKMEFAD